MGNEIKVRFMKIDKLIHLDLVKELAQENKPLPDQLAIFKEKSNKSRATFFRYRSQLNLSISWKTCEYNMKDKGKCYFCLKSAQIIHHIDKDNKNNENSNLLPLCRSCHAKLHLIMKRIESAFQNCMNSTHETRD